MKPGDILVGKITPKSETELAPEERLLRAIFGEKAADVKDTSLTVPSGTYGIVMDVKVSSRREMAREKLTPAETKRQLKEIEEDNRKKKDELSEQLTEALCNILLGEKIPLDVVNARPAKSSSRPTARSPRRCCASWRRCTTASRSIRRPIRNKINEIIGSFETEVRRAASIERERSMDRVESGDDVDPGIIKQVKVYIATQAQAVRR